MAVSADANSADLVAGMKKLGLTDYESRVLLALIRSAPATAYELAKKSGVPRPNAYSALQGLEQRGAVMPVSEKPVRYAARDPQEFFRLVVAQTQQVCDELTTGLQSLAAPDTDNYVWNLEGASDAHAKVAELIAGAGSEIWVKGDAALLDLHAEALRQAAEGRGVALMVILFGTNPDDYRFTDASRVFVHEASGLRMGSADNLFTLVVDQVHMLTANDQDGVRAAHTRNRAVVKMALSLIRHDYYMAEIFQALKPELDGLFGPHLSLLRRRSFTEEQLASFRARTGLEG